MKRLILIKQSNSIDLAHLYEHIFCMHIERLFYNQHQFQYLDYSLVGKTYHGVVYIDLELYSDEAIALADEIQTLTVIFSEKVLFVAMAQLLAEEEEPLASTGYDKVKRALETLHEQQWRNIDDIELVDSKSIRKETGTFYVAEGRARPAHKLTASIVLNANFAASHRELLPLFRQFAWLIFSTLQSRLPEVHGYYSFTDTYKKTEKNVGLFGVFKVANTDDIEVDIADTLATCSEVVRDLRQNDAFTRYMHELRKISHYNNPNLAPNPESNYEDTLIFIGPKGWQKIATKENYELLLKHMSVGVKFGRKKASQILAR